MIGGEKMAAPPDQPRCRVAGCCRRHDGHCISKLLASDSFVRAGLPLSRYTEVITTSDVAALRDAANCPMLLQAYVDKRFEYRVTVVGDEVFAAEIDSQKTAHTRHDWRRYEHRRTPYRAHELPDEVATRCRRIVQCLGLRYGAIDLILAPDGRYVFLEINPSGEYDWIERRTGLSITDALCRLLIALDRGDDA